MIGPMIEYSKTGILVTFLALKLPYIDEDLVWGFHLNVAIQTTITTFGTVGGLATEMASCIVNNTILLCSEVISFNCDELSEKIKRRKTSDVENFAYLKQIMIQIQDLDRYIVEMSDIYYWRLFSAPILITYSVSISIFCQYVVSIYLNRFHFFRVNGHFFFFHSQLDFPCGYGFAILTYSQMMILCYMGNNVKEAVNFNNFIE